MNSLRFSNKHEKTPSTTFVRRPAAAEDQQLCAEARTVLASMQSDALPVNLACRYPRVMNQIARLWNRPAQLDRYFDDLLIDKRGGRQGFPFAVAAELAVLKHYYQSAVYPKAECVWEKVYTIPGAPSRA
jgi:hypothetical protein